MNPKKRCQGNPLLGFLFALLLLLGAGTITSVQEAFAQAPAPAAAPTGDPTGETSAFANGVANPLKIDDTLKDVKDPAVKNAFSELYKLHVNERAGINMTWTLVTGFLVFFMQAGFALVETGFCRAKNAAHTMTMNMMVFCVGVVGWYICGFAFMFGGFGSTPTLGDTSALSWASGELSIGGFDIIGTKGFFLSGDFYDVSILALFLFQMVFMDTAATIPTGSTSERITWKGFLLMGLWVSMFIYPLVGNWVWGGGWLADMGVKFGLGHGAVDFAGSGVVHEIGGAVALAGAIAIGPRIGKYGPNGEVRAIPGHNMPLAILGTIILYFGWFGFNPGSTLSATDLRISDVAVTTMIAGGFGGVAAMFYMWIFEGKPDPGYSVNGILAGLVAITAPCAFVNPTQAAIIGVLAGGWVCVAGLFIERKLKIDDPVGAIAVHFANGAWGLIALGIFADGTYGEGWNGVKGRVKGVLAGDGGQLVAQFIDAITIAVVVGVASFIFFKIVDAVVGLRVSPDVELAGLDVPEMGIWGYPDPEASFSGGLPAPVRPAPDGTVAIAQQQQQQE
ncbi:ammonium transporter [Gloeobacter kilaueensis]|uniref:Ammonium transporter n=1 Tax=Gloeobacter kilaueensis (strain ATCC BAA-2537 / CCAP 1431/1 / ULC 316 / JS1) TaxID=1183438 RepID=U5QD55_GLOK1|nr:ammonium transporter [Gloeobacter kilaueensis]AGY56832.1 ammonium transporter [Gloeobacter kilaueensis JS1]